MVVYRWQYVNINVFVKPNSKFHGTDQGSVSYISKHVNRRKRKSLSGRKNHLEEITISCKHMELSKTNSFAKWINWETFQGLKNNRPIRKQCDGFYTLNAKKTVSNHGYWDSCIF